MTTIHPSHHHPLLLHSTQDPLDEFCMLCCRRIWNQAYTCEERCEDAFFHRACVEAPPQIDSHPLHPLHPLTLLHNRSFDCDACHCIHSDGSTFRCFDCNFDLDICCAFSTLSDEGCSLRGKTSEQITLPLHPHTLTSFSIRHDFVPNIDCYICRESVQGDGYRCFGRFCNFIIHKRCIQDLYYADGTKAPRIYHGHPLETFAREDTDSSTCGSCGSHGSGEFIGCSSCQVFYHRHCFQVPEILQYPSHHPDHALVLFPHINPQPQCQSCSCSLEDEIYYRCTSCEFSVHVGCAFQVLAYYKEGMSAKIDLPWHRHPLFLCHLTESTPSSRYCIYCVDKSIGPSYVCQEEDCWFLLHKQCTENETTIKHPHHPDHPLILSDRDPSDHITSYCEACSLKIYGVKFSCKRCLFHLDLDCVVRFPTQKHYLHEHKLLHFKENSKLECNRCRGSTDSSFFRCVPCNFNIHEECMELPQKVKSKIHWHPLTLHETFVEDDSGEYYCEECEKTRDPRLGAYVCGECKLSLPRIYHMECVLPELAKVYAEVYEERLVSEVKKLNKEIAGKKEKLQEITLKLEETTVELDELKNRHNILLERLPEWKRNALCLYEETVNDSD